MSMKVGDSVRVQDGFIDEGTDQNMSGWQGRILELSDETAFIEFDSVTLQNMPSEYIEQCELEGYGWGQYGFDPAMVEVVEARDQPGDASEARIGREADFHYSHLGEDGRAIHAILHDIDDPYDDLEEMKIWAKHLKIHLSFPFEAVVDEVPESSPLGFGDRLKIRDIGKVDANYGVMGKIRTGRRVGTVPLCDLKVADETSPNYNPIRLYALWYANR